MDHIDEAKCNEERSGMHDQITKDSYNISHKPIFHVPFSIIPSTY